MSKTILEIKLNSPGDNNSTSKNYAEYDQIKFKLDSLVMQSTFEEIITQIKNVINDSKISDIAIQMDFRVYTFGGLGYAKNSMGETVNLNDKNYYGILKAKEEFGYPVKVLMGGSRYIHDGDWAIAELCKFFASTDIVKNITFAGSQFYPGSPQALATLANTGINLDFKEATFFNTDPEFFKNTFTSSNSNTQVSFDDTTLICQKGDSLGISGSQVISTEHFASLDMEVEIAGGDSGV